MSMGGLLGVALFDNLTPESTGVQEHTPWAARGKTLHQIRENQNVCQRLGQSYGCLRFERKAEQPLAPWGTTIHKPNREMFGGSQVGQTAAGIAVFGLLNVLG